MADEQKILNLISDIRDNVDELAETEDKLVKAENEVEDFKADIRDLKAAIASNREILEDLIDEATGQNNEDEFGMRSGRSNSY